MLEQGPDFWCWFDTTQFSYIPLCSPNTCKYVFNPNVTTFQSNCAEGLHFSAFINPRRACAARVTVVVLCVCMCVCMYVCVYVCPLIPAASHIGITKERYQLILRNTGIVLNFADFPKNALFKSYSVICLPRAAPAS